MIIATAGHVDHGKTLLVRALTGVDTDRLPEEKKRNLTIDLGFAYLPIEGQETVGFIDVPGHERFIRNALCGLAGTDFVLFVVAADDGPMPQTEEHLAIIDLLGISHGAIALTKTDRVAADQVARVRDDINTLCAQTSLRGAEIFPVSALTGNGMDALRAHLLQAAKTTPPRPVHNNFRLAVDRAFDVVGAGFVVTGTVFSGSTQVGDTVKAPGPDMALRIRGIHAQNTKSETGQAGQRCALNLTGLDLRKELIGRGNWITAEGTPGPVPKFDAELRVLKSEGRPLAHWTPVHVHLGAAEVTGRVAVLEARNIQPGDAGLAQLVLDRPLGAVHGDSFIIRDQSARRTIGGGRVVDIFPPRRGRAKPARIAWLNAMKQDDSAKALADVLALSDQGVELDRFAANRNLTPGELAAIESAVRIKLILTDDTRLGFADGKWTMIRAAALARLADWHKASPGAVGLSENQLLAGTGIKLAKAAVVAIAAELVRDGAIVKEGMGVRLPTHRAQLQAADLEIWGAVNEALSESGIRPLSVSQVAQATNLDVRKLEPFFGRASRHGLVVRFSKTRICTPATLRELAGIVQDLAQHADDELVSVVAFRDASGIGRNIAIEVLEFFDRQGFTQRVGDGRKVLQESAKVFG